MSTRHDLRYDGSVESTILAALLDDCWEPAEVADLLPRLAHGAPGSVACLRMAADGARIVGTDFDGEDEPPGSASYLWVLWSGPPPTIGEMAALHAEHVRVMRRAGADDYGGSTTPRRSSSEPSIR